MNVVQMLSRDVKLQNEIKAAFCLNKSQPMTGAQIKPTYYKTAKAYSHISPGHLFQPLCWF